jgi:hypothetical protein
MLNKKKTLKDEGLTNISSGFSAFCRPSEEENWKLQSGRWEMTWAACDGGGLEVVGHGGCTCWLFCGGRFFGCFSLLCLKFGYYLQVTCSGAEVRCSLTEGLLPGCTLAG